eukprot:TRINITY_DN21678_c0_g1_i3.p1 TRINITY_DN21678_c0_g1~~TRINITY_DN21678_c0_g1_i3.p1  ORF type:complete len:846 (-),score=247.09 TRINITY_DN21678_c0_g1_i3:105-2615(-)
MCFGRTSFDVRVGVAPSSTIYICRLVQVLVASQFFFFFSSRRRHTRCREVSWARRCVQETGINAEYMGYMELSEYLKVDITRKSVGADSQITPKKESRSLTRKDRKSVYELPSSSVKDSPSKNLLKKYNPFNKRSARGPAPSNYEEPESYISEHSYYSEFGKKETKRFPEKAEFGSQVSPKQKSSQPLILETDAALMEKTVRPIKPRETPRIDPVELKFQELREEINRAREQTNLPEKEFNLRLSKVVFLESGDYKAPTSPSDIRLQLLEQDEKLKAYNASLKRLQAELNDKQLKIRELQVALDSAREKSNGGIELSMKNERANTLQTLKKLFETDFLVKCNRNILTCQRYLDDLAHKEGRINNKLGLLKLKLKKAKPLTISPSAQDISSEAEYQWLAEKRRLDIETLKLKYEDENHKLRKDIQSLEDQLEEKNRDFEDIRGKYVPQVEVDEIEARLQKSLHDAKNELEEQKRLNNDLKGSVESLSNLPSEVQDLQTRIEYYENEIEESRRQNSFLKENISGLEKTAEQIQEMKRKILQYEEELSLSNRTNEDLRLQLSGFESQNEHISKIEKDNEILNRENINLRKENDELKNSIKNLNLQNAQQIKEIENLKQDMPTMGTEELKTEIDHLKKENENKENEVKSLKQDIENKLEEIEKLKTEKEKSMKEIIDYNVRPIQKTQESKQEAIEDEIQEEKKSHIIKSDDLIKGKQQEIKDLKQAKEIEDLKKENIQKTQEIDYLKVDIEQKNQEIDDLKQENQDIILENEQIIKEIDDLKEENRNILKKIEITTISSEEEVSQKSVSYTHLRAHETSLHLVCRLLLEKKKKNCEATRT